MKWVPLHGKRQAQCSTPFSIWKARSYRIQCLVRIPNIKGMSSLQKLRKDCSSLMKCTMFHKVIHGSKIWRVMTRIFLPYYNSLKYGQGPRIVSLNEMVSTSCPVIYLYQGFTHRNYQIIGIKQQRKENQVIMPFYGTLLGEIIDNQGSKPLHRDPRCGHQINPLPRSTHPRSLLSLWLAIHGC